MKIASQLNAQQDVVAVEMGGDLSAWTEGPLPNQAMEQAACELFADSHPMGLWSEPGYKAERDQARKQIIRAYVRFLKANRWTLSNMVERLEDGFARVVCGDVDPSPTQRVTLRDYAAECLQGLFARFSGDLNPMVLPDTNSHAWMIPQGPGISDVWRQSFVATKFAEVLAALTCPGVPFLTLDVKDRTWLRQQTDQLVEDAVVRFEAVPGDPEYRPEQEPEYDFDGRTENEAGQ